MTRDVMIVFRSIMNTRFQCRFPASAVASWATEHLFLSTWIVLFLRIAIAETTSTAFNSTHSWMFTAPRYNVSIVENCVGKTYVVPSTEKMGIFLADDAEITYAIVDGNTGLLFKAESRRVGDFCFLRIRTRSGVQAVINREQKDMYRLVVRASVKVRSGPVHATQAEVFVSVTDTNDLSPLFDPSNYNVVVMETALVHQTVVTVTASDADIGVNAEIFYSFTAPTNAFVLHPTTGVVTVARKLNMTETSLYQLTVVATDRGYSQERGSSRFSVASLVVTVVPMNQYSPVVQVQTLPAVSELGQVSCVN